MSAHSTPPLRVILADEHPIFRIGISAVIDHGDRQARIVAQASHPEELMHLLNTHQPDVLITDLVFSNQQPNAGLQMLNVIRQDFPLLPILVVTQQHSRAFYRSILKLNIQGLMSKSRIEVELPAALACIRNNRTYIAESVHRVMVDPYEQGAPLPKTFEQLSPREQEVLKLYATGTTIVKIAEQLQRSKQTVSAQKISGMRKLGMHNEAALLIYLRDKL